MVISKCPALHPAIPNAPCTLANYFQIFILLHLILSSIIVGPPNPQPFQAAIISFIHSKDTYWSVW